MNRLSESFINNIGESLADYNNDMARALAGAITGKSNDDLDDADVEKAKEVSSKIPELGDYIKLHNALDANDTNATNDLVMKYENPMAQNTVMASMEESDLVDRDILRKKGYNYYGVFEDEKLRSKVTRFLDEEEVEYMDDGSGHLQMKFNDREKFYKIESALGKMNSRNNPHFMRDSENYENAEMVEDMASDIKRAGKNFARDSQAFWHGTERLTKYDRKTDELVQFDDEGLVNKRIKRWFEPDAEHEAKKIKERAPDEPKYGTDIEVGDEEATLPSFKEWRSMNPDIKNHGKAKRAYKSWLGTQVTEEQLDEFNPFDTRSYGSAPKNRFDNMPVDQLQNIANKLSRDGAPSPRSLQKRIAELNGEEWIEESVNAKYNKAETLKPVKESLDMGNKKLDEHVLGMTRLQTLAGIPVSQIDEADEVKEEELDESLFDEAEDDMVDLGMDAPMDIGEPVMDVDPEMGPPADGMGAEVDMMEPEVDMEPDVDMMEPEVDPMGDTGDDIMRVNPMDEPIDVPVDDDFGMDSAMDDIASVEGPALPEPAMDMAPMETDVRADIETALTDMLTKAPDLKISDYKDVVHRAEEVVSQIRAMGGQFLKEGKKLSKKDAAKTIRESADTGFKKALFTANSK